ncbi:MAG: hypothetical protein KY445_16565, partial [Armatimonadetes bacterium]|nr:hypothetical protein [Armatimonadota bacterium]
MAYRCVKSLDCGAQIAIFCPQMTTNEILSHSPDPASTQNAKSLAKPEKWTHLGAFDGDEGEVIWGEIKGSSGEIYRSR